MLVNYLRMTTCFCAEICGDTKRPRGYIPTRSSNNRRSIGTASVQEQQQQGSSATAAVEQNSSTAAEGRITTLPLARDEQPFTRRIRKHIMKICKKYNIFLYFFVFFLYHMLQLLPIKNLSNRNPCQPGTKVTTFVS
jgi:hypothetical protein